MEEVTDVSTEHAVDALTENVSEKKANRFYDRLRSSMASYLASKGKAAGTAAEFLLFVPDVFILLWRLTTDKRVGGNNKVLLGTGIAYYFFPLDIMPEAFLGPVGFLDDLVFAAYILNRILNDTDEKVLREHWSGDGDVLEMIRRVLAAADQLATTDFVKKVKKIVK
jgi:uncharacterized membrane protein YkvA (DUF1232 family)